MGVQFTPQQQEVIDMRDCNVLVSAAAGSGKTAVLTQRIVNMICDEDPPIDVDRLLVVTFTNAAAAEMRERIGSKLSDMLAEHPESEHLQRQAILLHNAQITTIDSFCLFLVKNHFREIGLDPAFRVADEREIKLMQQETMGELLEDAFAENRQEFLESVEALCVGSNEKALEMHILNLSRYAASFPWPDEWLLERKRDFTRSDASLKDYYVHYLKGILSGCIEKYSEIKRIVEQPDGPYMYGECVEQELEQFEQAAEHMDCDRAEEFPSLFESIKFGKLSAKKDDTVDPAKREMVKDIREEVKKVFQDLQKQFFGASSQTMQKRNDACNVVVTELINLVLDFNRRMQEKKQEKKLIDFTDMEHYALNILLKYENGEVHATQVAKQYRDYFHEILIDEYQDSNLVQEYLLQAISGEEDGVYNRFMVGDVKQSIYRFRLARPELFLDKYHKYGREGKERRIDLAKNFRSRDTVVDTVNRIFEKTMSKEIGGIEYDEAASLYQGAEYPECEGQESELLLVQKPPKGDELKTRQAEAKAIGDRIHSLCRDGKVTDRQTGELRDIHYRDIVILLRTLSGWGDVFKSTLETMGIPAYVTSQKGYFTASEVQNILNFLRVIDNPLQDIPLYGVLRSCFGGFAEEEIAALRGQDKTCPLYECLLQSDQPRVVDFLRQLDDFRQQTSYLTIRLLLERIILKYDYLNYVTALPGGGKRRANVEMLLVKASDFEKTSYYGLFHFLRYMEMLEKYDEDYGEADTLDENADVVRIISIHKSKGLEYPVVFVAALSKKFNMTDVHASVILDGDLGIGMDYTDPVRRVRAKTLRKQIISKKLREDLLSEELRLLYVAMTRAREKVIMTAEVEKADELLARSNMNDHEDARLSYLEFMKASCYLDFLKPIIMQSGLKITVIQTEVLQLKEDVRQLESLFLREGLSCAVQKANREKLQILRDRFSFRYPYENLEKLYTKTTVSELKIAAMSEKDEAAYHAFEDRAVESYVPEFRRLKGNVTGTVRGNAYHRVMELLDFEKVAGSVCGDIPETYEEYVRCANERALAQALDVFLQTQLEMHRLTQEYRDAISDGKVVRFLRTKLGYRMWRAQRKTRLHREQPFVLAIPASRVDSQIPEDEQVLIQGIIDAYFEEDDGIVLLDYKTDTIPDMQSLWNRYRTQIDYYREALERLTSKRVKEKYLYSFHLEADGSDDEK